MTEHRLTVVDPKHAGNWIVACDCGWHRIGTDPPAGLAAYAEHVEPRDAVDDDVDLILAGIVARHADLAASSRLAAGVTTHPLDDRSPPAGPPEGALGVVLAESARVTLLREIDSLVYGPAHPDLQLIRSLLDEHAELWRAE
jgi:hypothetical protein